MRVRFLIAFLAILVGSCFVLAAKAGQATVAPVSANQSTNQAVANSGNKASHIASADNGCCVGRVGDANGSGEDEPSIGDVSVMIDAKFISMSCDDVTCISEADINQSGGANPTCEDVSIGDIAALIDYLFITGPSLGLSECLWGTVTDIDGNVYETVKIGSQVWMAENLKVTHYRNGDPIPHVTDNSAWAILFTGAYCDYNHDSTLVSSYGRLYNWYAVSDSRNIAPAGWHVPTDEDWKVLEMYLGMSQAEADTTSWRGADEGGKLKEAGTAHWPSPNTGATNSSGFTAVPGGYRAYSGSFYNMRYFGAYWTSTPGISVFAWYRGLYYDRSTIDRSNHDRTSGIAVRCLRD